MQRIILAALLCFLIAGCKTIVSEKPLFRAENGEAVLPEQGLLVAHHTWMSDDKVLLSKAGEALVIPFEQQSGGLFLRKNGRYTSSDGSALSFHTGLIYDDIWVLQIEEADGESVYLPARRAMDGRLEFFALDLSKERRTSIAGAVDELEEDGTKLVARNQKAVIETMNIALERTGGDGPNLSVKNRVVFQIVSDLAEIETINARIAIEQCLAAAGYGFSPEVWALPHDFSLGRSIEDIEGEKAIKRCSFAEDLSISLASSYALARAYIAAEQYADAWALTEKLMSAQYPISFFLAARMHFEGLGKAADPEATKALLIENAERVKGLDLFLGQVLQTGQWGIEKDIERARKLYEAGARRNDPVGHYLLGRMLGTRDAAEADAKLGFEHMQKAAKSGLPLAYELLGWMYNFGVGTPVNYKEALKAYAEAGGHGMVYSNYSRGFLYAHGAEGLEPSPHFARQALRKASKKGYAAATAELGRLIGLGEGGKRDYQEGLRLLKRAEKDGANKDLVAVYTKELRESLQGFYRFYLTQDDREHTDSKGREWRRSRVMTSRYELEIFVQKDYSACRIELLRIREVEDDDDDDTFTYNASLIGRIHDINCTGDGIYFSTKNRGNRLPVKLFEPNAAYTAAMKKYKEGNAIRLTQTLSNRLIALRPTLDRIALDQSDDRRDALFKFLTGTDEEKEYFDFSFLDGVGCMFSMRSKTPNALLTKGFFPVLQPTRDLFLVNEGCDSMFDSVQTDHDQRVIELGDYVLTNPKWLRRIGFAFANRLEAVPVHARTIDMMLELDQKTRTSN